LQLDLPVEAADYWTICNEMLEI